MHAVSAYVAGALLVSGPLLAQTPAAKSPATAPVTRPSVTAGIVSAKVERVARDRATLTVAAKAEVAPQLKLFDAAGKEVTVVRMTEGGLKAEVDPTRGYVLAPPPPPRRALSREGLQLPARYVTFGATGGPQLGGLFIRPAVVPLTWSEAAKAYATELVVGYEFEDGREAALAAPKTVTFFAEGANARVQADTVTISRSGGSGYQRVTLSTGQIEGETHFTARVSALDELKASVAVQREPGALALSLPSRELPAFGIGSGELTVSVLARDGMPLATSRPITVALSSRRLRQPPSVSVEAGKTTAVAEFRTAGIGADEIVAQSGALRATLPVVLVFPVAAVVAAALGGALGGATRYLRNKGRRGSLLVRRVVEGLLVGVILVGAAWAGLVGVDLSTGILGTPFGAFVLAALSGYLGCVVLDRVANKTFGSGKAD